MGCVWPASLSIPRSWLTSSGRCDADVALLLVCLVLTVLILSRMAWRWFELGASLVASIVSEVLAAVFPSTCGSYAAGTWAELLRMLAFANFCSYHERDVLGWSILDPLTQDEDSLPPAAVGGKSQTYADPSWPVATPTLYRLRRSDGTCVFRWKNIIRLCTLPIHVLLVVATAWMALCGERSGTFSLPSGAFAGSDGQGYSPGHGYGWMVVGSKVLYLVCTGLIAVFDLVLVFVVARCMVQHHRARAQPKQPYALWLMVVASPFLLADAAWNIWAVVTTARANTMYALTWGNIPAWMVAALLIATAIPKRCQGSFGKGVRNINTGTMQGWGLDEEQTGLNDQPGAGPSMSGHSSRLSSHAREPSLLRLQPTISAPGGDSSWQLGQFMHEVEERDARAPLSAY